MPYLWNIPLILCYAASAALLGALTAVQEGEYLNAIGLVGIGVLCCRGALTIFEHRRERRSWS